MKILSQTMKQNRAYASQSKRQSPYSQVNTIDCYHFITQAIEQDNENLFKWLLSCHPRQVFEFKYFDISTTEFDEFLNLEQVGPPLKNTYTLDEYIGYKGAFKVYHVLHNYRKSQAYTLLARTIKSIGFNTVENEALTLIYAIKHTHFQFVKSFLEIFHSLPYTNDFNLFEYARYVATPKIFSMIKEQKEKDYEKKKETSTQIALLPYCQTSEPHFLEIGKHIWGDDYEPDDPRDTAKLKPRGIVLLMQYYLNQYPQSTLRPQAPYVRGDQQIAKILFGFARAEAETRFVGIYESPSPYQQFIDGISGHCFTFVLEKHQNTTHFFMLDSTPLAWDTYMDSIVEYINPIKEKFSLNIIFWLNNTQVQMCSDKCQFYALKIFKKMLAIPSLYAQLKQQNLLSASAKNIRDIPHYSGRRQHTLEALEVIMSPEKLTKQKHTLFFSMPPFVMYLCSSPKYLEYYLESVEKQFTENVNFYHSRGKPPTSLKEKALKHKKYPKQSDGLESPFEFKAGTINDDDCPTNSDEKAKGIMIQVNKTIALFRRRVCDRLSQLLNIEQQTMESLLAASDADQFTFSQNNCFFRPQITFNYQAWARKNIKIVTQYLQSNDNPFPENNLAIFSSILKKADRTVLDYHLLEQIGRDAFNFVKRQELLEGQPQQKRQKIEIRQQRGSGLTS